MFQTQVHNFKLPDSDIILYDNFFDPTESDRLYSSLLEKIKWQQDQITLFGKTYEVPRLTALYGDCDKAYTYSGITMKPHAWIEDLLFIKKRIEKVSNVSFSSCLLNLYRDGRDSNGWHQDNEKELGRNPIIGSVSFGETRPFHFRHIQDKSLETQKILLTHGSFLLMKGTTQHFWKHQIPKTSRKLSPRINLTFRIIERKSS